MENCGLVTSAHHFLFTAPVQCKVKYDSCMPEKVLEVHASGDIPIGKYYLNVLLFVRKVKSIIRSVDFPYSLWLGKYYINNTCKILHRHLSLGWITSTGWTRLTFRNNIQCSNVRVFVVCSTQKHPFGLSFHQLFPITHLCERKKTRK